MPSIVFVLLMQRSTSAASQILSLHGVVFAFFVQALHLARDHALALLQHPVIAPPQMRRGAAQRPPWLRQGRHLLRGRSRLQPQSDFDGFLYGDIAGGPGVAVAERPSRPSRSARALRKLS